MKYEVVIGIEIHCELKTKTKMFSSAPSEFGGVANTCVNEIDLGHPGALPSVNKEAVKQAIRACHALNLEIDPVLKFDRKNYFYPDLSKGFQITQQFFPIGKNGYVDIMVDDQVKKIGIERIHIEEDTAKQFHLDDVSLIDYNRAGTPLIEIVSKPDMKSGKEAAAYVEAIRQTLFYIGVSDVKMEEGSLRCDVNISLNKPNEGFGVKNEIKNINSISNIARAIDYEIKRQSELLDQNKVIVQSTRRYDDTTKTTILMREKEGSVDYKYMVEPNIFPIVLDKEWINEIIDAIPELPNAKRERFLKTYGLTPYDVSVLINHKALGECFEKIMETSDYPKQVANWLISDVQAYLSKENKSIEELQLNFNYFSDMIKMIEEGVVSTTQVKDVVLKEVLEGKNPREVVEEKGLKQVGDESFIVELVTSVLNEQAQSVEDFKNGKDRAVTFLMGQLMKKSKGQLNPKLANQILMRELKKLVDNQ